MTWTIYINYKDALPDVWLFIGQAVSEKKAFEYFGNIHVYSPGMVADQPPLGSKVFYNHKSSVHLPISY